MRHFDSLVIGAGPAGVTAALYLARFGLNVAIAEKLAPGGLLLQTFEIENYPGFPKPIKGYELADALSAQIEPYSNITRLLGEIKECKFGTGKKQILVDDEWVEADTVIICSGVRYRKLGLPNEGKLLGKGLSHCALCDGHFFRNQVVGVVGGGNSAIEESLHLAKLASDLHIIHRREEFRAAPIYLSRLKSQSNVHFQCGSVVTALHGENQLEGVTLKRLKTGEEEFLPMSGLFIFIGLETDQHGFILTDTEMRTNLPGVFAAGDIRSKVCRQVVTAVGDGATAANSAFLYLEK